VKRIALVIIAGLVAAIAAVLLVANRPGADHYLQADEPELLADLVRSTLTGAPISHEIAGLDCQHNKLGACVGVQ
jgi:hypothetical protein